MSNRLGDFHPQALPETSLSLSTHTAPDVWLMPCHSRQLAKKNVNCCIGNMSLNPFEGLETLTVTPASGFCNEFTQW